jgi:FKBP-type peptidyl-prolyl cis-trans isomerase SlyD
VNVLEVQDGMVVELEYTLSLEDGEVVDSNVGEEPLVFLQGAGEIIEGLEEELVGMKVGESRRIILPPERAYGEWDPDAVEELDRDELEGEADIEVGMNLELQGDDGTTFDAYVVEVDDDTVVLDLNPPLAGETLTFDVKILGLREATPEESAHGHAHAE